MEMVKNMEAIINLLDKGAGGNILLVIALLVAIVIFVEKMFNWISKKFKFLYNKKKNIETNEDILKQSKKDIENLDTQVSNINKALISIMADRLNSKYKEYLAQQYIPEDELEGFIEFHDAYNNIGGNHTGDVKFNKAMELDVK